jgi:thioredoxin reductase (NADPH)
LEENKHYRVAIIGSGPAGLTAAIYAARADLKPLVIEGVQPGGQPTITSEIENYPGFPDGVLGPQIMDQFRLQAEKFGTTFITDAVSKVDLKQRPFKITIGRKEITSDTIIISTGASARLLGLESESRLMGHGVSACATCDGWFFRDKEIVVIGGGDSACEEAVYLTKFASKVTLIHRRDELRASKIMQQRALNHPKIDILWNQVPIEFVAGETVGLDSVRLKNTQTGEESSLKCQGAFIAIGHRPNTELFADSLELDKNKYIITKPDSTKTAIPGVFACGDVKDSVYQQMVTAAGSGCMAAIDAERFLTEEEA